jgi:hypothetical protein
METLLQIRIFIHFSADDKAERTLKSNLAYDSFLDTTAMTVFRLVAGQRNNTLLSSVNTSVGSPYSVLNGARKYNGIIQNINLSM